MKTLSWTLLFLLTDSVGVKNEENAQKYRVRFDVRQLYMIKGLCLDFNYIHSLFRDPSDRVSMGLR